ncbi:MAG: hypothetical protein K5793_00685 [Nitrosarchaeum sp.]|nr:hypothetical protein [Nitrosarchaeum sp.]
MGMVGTRQATVVLLVLSTGIVISSPEVFAQENTEFTKFEGDDIHKNPDAKIILDRIEESKKILAQMMEQHTEMTEQQKLVKEQRKAAEERLQIELERMNKEYEEYTPRNAFASFVSNFNATHHGIYWDQFEIMESKVLLARAAKQQVLENGGSFQEAQREYIKYASMPRIEMIRTIIDLNLKHGFAHKDTQVYFDENGKLPRYDDENMAICYGCLEYENIRNTVIDSESNPYLNEETTNTLDSTIQIVSDKEPIQVSYTEPYVEKDSQISISKLEEKMDMLGQQMINEEDFEKQKEIRKAIVKVAQAIERLMF